MQIQPIYSSSIQGTSKLNSNSLPKQSAQIVKTDLFVKNTNPTFTGPYRYFEKALLQEVKSGADYQALYRDLIRGVKQQSGLRFREGFDFVDTPYTLRQVLNDLRCPAPWGYEKTLVKAAENEDLTLLTCSGNKLVSIRNNGPHGLIDTIAGNDRIVDTRVVFHDFNDSTKTIEFGMDKDGDFLLERPYDLLTFWDNGNQKMVKNFSGDYRSSNTTYYNRDGSESFWKNLFS